MKRAASLDLADLAQLHKLRRPPDRADANSAERPTKSLDLGAHAHSLAQQLVQPDSPRYKLPEASSDPWTVCAAGGLLEASQQQRSQEQSSAHAASSLSLNPTPAAQLPTLWGTPLEDVLHDLPVSMDISVPHDKAEPPAAAAATSADESEVKLLAAPGYRTMQSATAQHAGQPASMQLSVMTANVTDVAAASQAGHTDPSPAHVVVVAVQAAAHGADGGTAAAEATQGADAAAFSTVASTKQGMHAQAAMPHDSPAGTAPTQFHMHETVATTAGAGASLDSKRISNARTAAMLGAAAAAAEPVHRSPTSTECAPIQLQVHVTEEGIAVSIVGKPSSNAGTVAAADAAATEPATAEAQPASAAAVATEVAATEPDAMSAPETAIVAAAAPIAGPAAPTGHAAGLTVTGLKSVLRAACADRADIKDHMIPVRCLAKLLHGQDADLSTVQLAEVLPQVGVLLQHMRDRLGGKVEGKSVLQPRYAAGHAKCLLFVLGLPEVQAVLGDNQQVQQLKQAVQAARQDFDQHPPNPAAAAAACLDAGGTLAAAAAAAAAVAATARSNAQQAPHAVAQGQAQAVARVGSQAGIVSSSMEDQAYAAGCVAAAAATTNTADLQDLQGLTPDVDAQHADEQQTAAGEGLSVAQLLEVLQNSGINAAYLSRARTTIAKLLQLVHGAGADAAAVQAAGLLQQWPVLCAYLLQRVQGLGAEPRMQAVTAIECYLKMMLLMLSLPQVQSQFANSDLQRLQQQVNADKASFFKKHVAKLAQQQLVSSSADSPADGDIAAASHRHSTESAMFEIGMSNGDITASGDDGLGSSKDGDIAVAGAACASAGTMETVAHLKQGLNKYQCVAVHGVAEAAGFDSSSRESQLLSAVLQPQYIQQYLQTMQDRGHRKEYVRAQARMLRNIAGRSDVQLCLGTETVQQLQQAAALVLQQLGKASSQGVALATAASALQPSDGSGWPAAQPNEAYAHQHAGVKLEDPGATVTTPAAGAGTGTGLSLKQLATHCKLANWDAHVLTPLRSIAKMLYGREFDPDAVQVADLVQHWTQFHEQLQQQAAGTHPTLPAVAVATALNYCARTLQLLEQPLVQAQLSPHALQQVQRQVESTKASFSSSIALRSARDEQGMISSQQEGSARGTIAQEGGSDQLVTPALRTARAGGVPVVACLGIPQQTTPVAAATAAAAGEATSPASQPMPFAALPQSVAAAAAAGTGLYGPSAAVLSDTAERNLLAAQRQLLWLYTHRLSPSLSSKLSFRSTMQMLAGLPPDDIRLDRFWADYDWVLVLSEDPGSQPEHWREAFDALLSNAARDM